MSKYYVTQGKQVKKLQAPEELKWEQLSVEKLEYLQMDLPSIEGEDVGFDRDDISVPSPWANVILFDSMLANKDSAFGALARKTKTEWRALITLLALKNILNIKVDFKKISIADSTEGNISDRNFLDRIYHMRPKVSVFEDENSWKEIYLIEIYGQTIGMITDSSFVCSLYKYKNNEATRKLIEKGLMNEKLQWIDPIDMIKHDMALSVFMTEWLETLRTWLVEENGRNISILTNLIEEFTQSINNEKLRKFNEDDEEKFITIRVKSNNEILRAYDLLTAIEVVRINLKNDTVLSYISVEEKVDTFVLEFLSPAMKKIFAAYEEVCQRPEGTILNDNIVFEKELYLFDCILGAIGNTKDKIDKSMFVEREEEDGTKTSYQIIIPIKEEILGIIPAERLREKLGVEQYRDGSIKISIKFYIDGEVRYLEKEYAPETIKELPKGEYPNIDMWPYVKFIDSGNDEVLWNEYYISSRNHNNGLELRVKYYGMDWENEWKNSCIWEDDFDTPGNIRILKIKQIPTYVSVVIRDTVTEREKNHGIVLLKEPEIAKVNKAKTARVGVDFGTSSTTAFCTMEGETEEIKFISFGHKDLSIVTPCIGKNDNAAYDIYASRAKGELLDRQYQNRRAYPSLIYKCDNGQHSPVSRIEEPFKWGKIKFKPQGDRDTSGRKVIDNMKWGWINDEVSREAAESYLSQIAKYITCMLARNGIGSIIWRFSYPTAMPNRYDFMGRTKDIIKNIQDTLKIDSKIISEKAYYPESIVSAKFFADTDDYICVDIGGGSSDISVWRGGYDGNSVENILQFSIGIASRKIFLSAFSDLLLSKDKEEGNVVKDLIKSFDYIVQTHESKFEIDKYIEEFEKAKSDGIEKFSRQIEPVFLLTGDEMRKTVKDRAKTEVVEKFYRAIALGLWGILYYTAISFKYIKDEFKEKNRTMKFYFAGTGSKMYDWLTENYKHNIHDAFYDVVNSVMEKLPEEKYRVSEFEYEEAKLKTEAAIGLLKMEETERDVETNIILPNAGITYIAGKKVGADDNIFENEEIKTFFENNSKKHINDVSVDFEETDDIFNEFIRIFNEQIIDNPVLEIEMPDVATLNSEARKIINENGKNHIITPAFIVKLEALIRCMRETR